MTAEYERRKVRLHALFHAVDTIEESRSPALPWTPELADAFGTREALLVELHAHWHRRLAGRLEALVERGAAVEEAVEEWHQLTAETPGVRALLEAAAPLLADACRDADFALACAVGLAATGDDPENGARAWRRALAGGSTDDRRCWRKPLSGRRVPAPA